MTPKCLLHAYVRLVQTSPEGRVTMDEPVCRRHVGMMIGSAVNLRGKLMVEPL